MRKTTSMAPARRGWLRAGADPLLASVLWGGMYVVSRASFGVIPPVTLATLRVVIGGATLWLALRLVGGRVSSSTRWERRDHLRALLCGLVVAGCIITQFAGTALASAHDGALLTTITPVFIVPLAWLLLGERSGWRVYVGMLVALAGVAIVVAAQVAGSSAGRSGSALLGDGLLLFSAFCWALFTVLGAPLTRRYATLPAVTAATLWSIPFMLPLAALELALRPHGDLLALRPASVGAVLYLAWGATALAWFLWYRGVEKLPAAVAAVFFFAQPLAGGILSAIFLREALGAGFWIGGAILAAGIAIVSQEQR